MEDLDACTESSSLKLSPPYCPHSAATGNFYSPSPTWISNAQLPSLPVIQPSYSNGQVLAGPFFTPGSSSDVTGTNQVTSLVEPVVQGVPFAGNGMLKPEHALSALSTNTAHQQPELSSSMPASHTSPHEEMLHPSACSPVDPAILNERIQQLSLDSSISLEDCCPCEWKMLKSAHVSNHNMGTLASASSVIGQPSEPTHLLRSLEPENEAPACDCCVSMRLNAPGTELSLAIVSAVDSGSEQLTGESNSALRCMNVPRMSKSGVERAVSRKDEMFVKLVQQVRELEVQLQERKEWAHKKAMQAACKFSKDMSELQSLRLEHEEILRLKRDTQSLEDSTMKRLTEMESALRKAGAQVDRANATVRKLETENAELRAEMEAAKLSAAECNAMCQEVAKREKKSTKKIQAWEKQKAKLLDEIAKQKLRIVDTQRRFVEVKSQQDEADVKWRQEEKAKEEALSRADAERWAKEQIEMASKRKEEFWCQKSEADFQRHSDDIKRLECELEQLKLTVDAGGVTSFPSIAGLPLPKDGRSLQVLKETNLRLLRELAELQDSRGDVRQDRECVMCMSEESSIVFLPCAHQIVCAKCNDLHKKQGMKDCPSCRTTIQSRVHVSSTRN